MKDIIEKPGDDAGKLLSDKNLENYMILSDIINTKEWLLYSISISSFWLQH